MKVPALAEIYNQRQYQTFYLELTMLISKSY
jgi:hypothetical protein